MGESDDQTHDASLAALLRSARFTYQSAFRSAHAEAGFDDIPRDGAFVIGSIAGAGSPLSDVIWRLHLSKQASGQLVDTLVQRGYLARATDPDDRRRLVITLTELGREAAAVGRRARERVDRALIERVGPEYVAHTRATLTALSDGDLLDDGGAVAT
jgi:DNA-binding MarR family transcriptional regulator